MSIITVIMTHMITCLSAQLEMWVKIPSRPTFFPFWNNELTVQTTGSLITNEWLPYSEWPTVYCKVTVVNTKHPVCICTIKTNKMQ